MIFGKKESPSNDQDHYVDYQEIDFPDFNEKENNVDIASVTDSNAIDFKRSSFYSALQNKKLEDLLLELKNWYEEQRDLRKKNMNLRIEFVKSQIQLVRLKMDAETERLGKTTEIENELLAEKEKIILDLDQLQNKSRSLTEELGNAHKDLIEKRLNEVKQELNAIVELYNVVFENKYKNEAELKIAVEKQRQLCEEMIDSNQKQLERAKATLEKDYLFGATRFSAIFKVSAGLMATFSSAWLFAIFSDSYDLESQNWLFFILNNTFNYLSLYVIKFGPFMGSVIMILGLLILLGLISIIVYLSQSFIHKMTNDKFDSQFGFNLVPKEKGLLKFNVNSSSLLSFWLQLLPWLFGFGLFLILLAVGQSNGGDLDQIGKLGQRLTNQFIGGGITLLCAGLYLVYHIKVIEPRKLDFEKRTDDKNQFHKRWLNKELILLVIVLNAFLIAVAIGQSVPGFIENRKNLLALICFIVLVNLTAFILSSGIRQLGLYKLMSDCGARIITLSNYRKALAGSKPIQVWIQEENQFKKQFIEIQKELFELIRTKNKSLNQLRQVNKNKWFRNSDSENENSEFEPVGKLNLSRKKEAQFFLINFPDLAYQIEELRNDINSKKRELDEVKTKIRLVKDGHSDFHITVNNEVARLKRTHDYLQRQLADLDARLLWHYQELHLEFRDNEAKIIEGHHLGQWTKQTLIA